MDNISIELVKSWANRTGNVSSNQEIHEWIAERNSKLKVDIEKASFSYDGFWFYDDKTGFIRNQNNSFFQLAGFQEIDNNQIVVEQPVILQNEIGYLGIICKMINGCLNFLMQAKIEPGNINVIQISPTLQATKSNFTQKHGGKSPNYLQYFIGSKKHTILVDQVQSEQSSRFFKKRNRNIVILVEEDIPVLSSHKWMTLGQIKELMKLPNLVNMDTRTVLSCLQMCRNHEDFGLTTDYFLDKTLYCSIYKEPDYQLLHSVYNDINDYKMFNTATTRLLPLGSLKGWSMTDTEIICNTPYDFKVIYCKIEIEEREVKCWEQPLIEALGKAVFGVFSCIDNGIRKYTVRAKHEIGCFDGMELGPLIQLEPSNPLNRLDSIEKRFLQMLENREGIVTDVVLSEEGGRFYHEQNRNVIIEIDKEELGQLPDCIYWMDHATISEMIQFSNNVNIQLRNLFSLIDI